MLKEAHVDVQKVQKDGRRNQELIPCLSCAACCFIPAEVIPQDLIDPSFVCIVDGVGFMKRKEDGSCICLNETRCSIYAFRPTSCRVFKRGGEGCLRAIESFQSGDLIGLDYPNYTPEEKKVIINGLTRSCAERRRLDECVRRKSNPKGEQAEQTKS